MRMNIHKTIGKQTYHFQVEAEDFQGVVEESRKLSFGKVDSCALCGDENLYLHAYTTKEGNFKYVKVVCGNCRGSVTFGAKKDGSGTYYLRKNEDRSIKWEAYEEKGASKGAPVTPEGEDQIPF